MQLQRLQSQAAFTLQYAVQRQRPITTQAQLQWGQGPTACSPAVARATGNHADHTISFDRLQRLQTRAIESGLHRGAGRVQAQGARLPTPLPELRRLQTSNAGLQEAEAGGDLGLIGLALHREAAREFTAQVGIEGL